jgi:uncharacterized protein (DUF342 family)
MVTVVASNLPTLAYNARQYRVRIELTRTMVQSSPLPPADLMVRTKAKLESIKKEGKIQFFELYEERLNLLWKKLRVAETIASGDAISVTVGAGSPAIVGLTVSNAGAAKPGVFVSTAVPIDLSIIPREWIRMSVNKMAIDQGIIVGLFAPQLQSAIMRISMGEKLDRLHITSKNALPPISLDGKIYSILANKSRGEVVVFIGDLIAIQGVPAQETLCTAILQTIKKLSDGGAPNLKFLKAEMLACIKSAASGPERVGLDMPLAVLAAIPEYAIPASAVASTNAAADATAKSSEIKKYLHFEISEDKMLATIEGFSMRLYSNPAFVMSKVFLVEQMLISQVKFGMTDEHFNAIDAAFKSRQSLDHMTAAEGAAPIVGAEPYLHLIYKDAPKEKAADAVINIRDAQQRSLVKKDQFVAEVRYGTPPFIGHDVTGKPLVPAAGAALPVTIGEGIQAREAGKFYATLDGIPRFEAGTLTISKMFVHNGDVNLKSGNIYFDGPVEITGSIEKGALVRVRGPLKVHGSITGATVISKEPIEVLQSINTGDAGKVICATQIKADFIENSRIECDGSITAVRSIISSQIFAGQFVYVTSPDGVLGGGNIVCRGSIFAANIGFTNGAKTTFLLGIDHKIARRINIRTKRLDSVTKAQERYKHEFRELAQKKENQLTIKHKQHKEVLKVKMTKVRELIEKVQKLLDYSISSKTYNAESTIAASNIFASNCEIEISGHLVRMEVDTIAAAVCAKERRNSHICTFDEVKADVERKVNGSSGASAPVAKTPKAS